MQLAQHPTNGRVVYGLVSGDFRKRRA